MLHRCTSLLWMLEGTSALASRLLTDTSLLDRRSQSSEDDMPRVRLFDEVPPPTKWPLLRPRLYVTVRSVRAKVRRRGGGLPDGAAEGAGRFLRGPLHSGVLQQEMHTEFSRPVQNCW
ncbi:hypothetical protein EYF80_039065 [Liparis tanakae]|uniref:Secreted protein n=1 Tax=Liparis tanakae TaxID=230148 RepID=A0A4Z2GDF2_9TELE|nr:hypothetical protein EYF80_039065 [Liparis tanakae]